MPLIPHLNAPHNIIYYLGLLYIFFKLRNLFYFLRVFFRAKPLNLLLLYGQNSYVLITGASDGLGKAFAFAFASLGFNLVLISRNQEKLSCVKQEINALYPKISIVLVAKDFLDSREKGFFESIYVEIKDLDISIVINNVALDYCQEFLKTSVEDINNLMTVNLDPLVFLTYKLLPQMIARKRVLGRRSLVINVSSISGVLPTPYFAIYSSTKAFMESFTVTLREEYKGLVEFLVVRPNFMSTKMNFEAKVDFETIKPQDCVAGVLRDIGRSDDSNGNWKHHLLNSIYLSLNERLLLWYYMTFLGKALVDRCERGRKMILEKIEKKN